MKVIEMKQYFNDQQWEEVLENIELLNENEQLKSNGFFELENDGWTGIMQFMAHAFPFDKTKQGEEYWKNIVTLIVEKYGKNYFSILEEIREEITNQKLEENYIQTIEKSISDKFEGNEEMIQNFINSKFISVDHLFSEIPVSNDVFLTYMNREYNYELKLKNEYIESLPKEVFIISKIAYNAEVELKVSVENVKIPTWDESSLKQIKQIVERVQNRINGDQSSQLKLFNAIVDVLK